MKDLTHEDLRKWATALEEESPHGLGESLLRYAEAWRRSLEEQDIAIISLEQALEWIQERTRIPTIPTSEGEE